MQKVRAALTVLAVAASAVVVVGAGPAAADDEPALEAPTISLVAPATLPRNTSTKILGTITATRPVPAGTLLAVTRTDPESPAGVALRPSTVDAKGAFFIADTMVSGGDLVYRVSYAGSDVLAPATATATIKVPLTPVRLSIEANPTTTPYNSGVSVTARLSNVAYPGGVIEIHADPYGPEPARRITLRTGQSSVQVRAVHSLSLTAKFLGTTRFAPTSAKTVVQTRVAVSTVSTRQYKTANLGTVSYAHFRKTVHPYFTTTMTPYPHRKQRLQFQVHSGGAWKPWKNVDLPLNTVGKSYYTLTGSHSTGVFYRVRAAYLPGTSGDSVNYTTYAPYKYFTFTK
ncbi:hypothetical protein [Actinoplanes sp. M2I2]|uniref:hypothetical protein n=1 Tax=Actinoplanes sp. M2I2 TaxID=1734444 RepID=UPI00202152B3|nr:hypothetical protein [Actinoplanes sp. M2I2]